MPVPRLMGATRLDREPQQADGQEIVTDTYLYNGPLSRGADLDIIEEISDKKRANTCVLIPVTLGGDADAAYKIGRYLQDRYEAVTVLVSGICKSAGTLLAISARELVFAPYGELGPLDVQMIKEDKLATMESGLNISEAFQAIEDRAKDTYHSLISEILSASDGAASIHTAAHAAAEMIYSLYSPIFGAIDPEEVGSRSRAMRIGEEYTERLNSKWCNLKKQRVSTLSRAYPSHSFVIDFGEASALFERVRAANSDEMKFVSDLGLIARIPAPEAEFRCLHAEDEDEEGAAEGDTAST